MILLTHRFLAQITIEANTTFVINSGKVGLLNDNSVAKDANGLPFLPGTSIAGVLRHAIGKDIENDLFGFKGTSNDEDGGSGSRLIISPGLIVGKEGKVIEGLQNIDFEDSFYSLFRALPIRDHVKINSKGSAEKGAKYDEEVIFKGTRFVFEIELKGSKDDLDIWSHLLSILASPDFRLGSGTRKGHGEFKIIHEKSSNRVFDLTMPSDLSDYQTKTVSLNSPIQNSTKLNPDRRQGTNGWEKYHLQLKAKDFFLFGAGFGDGDVDHITKRERTIAWVDDIPKASDEEFILIPATSIKGALAHRVRYHYSKLVGDFVESPKDNYQPEATLDEQKILDELHSQIKWDDLDIHTPEELFKELEQKVKEFDPTKTQQWESFEKQLKDEAATILKSGDSGDESNQAIKTLFGFANNNSNDQEAASGKGSVLISDIYVPYHRGNDKVFNHVKIDRFTGGAIDGALFQEKAYYGANADIYLEIYVKSQALNEPSIRQAWENTVADLLQGGVPLGGMTTKGHGFFNGIVKES